MPPETETVAETETAAAFNSVAIRQQINRLARDAGFDLVAVADAAEFAADRDAALRRIDDGLLDGLPWFTKDRVQRGANPQELLPGARSIIALGLNYYSYSDTDSDIESDADARPPPSGLVARYARGRDYHRLMKRRMRRLVIALSETIGRQFAARWYVDDGPMLDRAAAARAGLGWFGKNGNILNPAYGSWLLLAQIITDLPLPPDTPLRKTCGACARCIPACPTDAIVAPYVVDNRRCISYLTIENRGSIPPPLRPAIGNWVFGCDICQEVCPVNRKAPPAADPNFGRRDLASLDLIALLDLTDDQFRRQFAGTPLMRAQRIGMQRNAAVALGNLGDASAVPALTRALQTAHPLVRQHAAWALGRIATPDAQAALRAAQTAEPDAATRAEIRQALTSQPPPTGCVSDWVV